MSKELVRGLTAPNDAEVLSTSEFLTEAFVQISNISVDLSLTNESTETGEVLDGMSDILELMRSILILKNIDPKALFEVAVQRGAQEGSFMDKKAITKE